MLSIYISNEKQEAGCAFEQVAGKNVTDMVYADFVNFFWKVIEFVNKTSSYELGGSKFPTHISCDHSAVQN